MTWDLSKAEHTGRSQLDRGPNPFKSVRTLKQAREGAEAGCAAAAGLALWNTITGFIVRSDPPDTWTLAAQVGVPVFYFHFALALIALLLAFIIYRGQPLWAVNVTLAWSVVETSISIDGDLIRSCRSSVYGNFYIFGRDIRATRHPGITQVGARGAARNEHFHLGRNWNGGVEP